MASADYISSYKYRLEMLRRLHGGERAMELIVGGLYLESGILEGSVLIKLGLKPEHSLIDVGCGSGRLPFFLRNYLRGKFIGTDILSEALAFAQKKCDRSDWEFTLTDSQNIPVASGTADFVSFFSVFTHILDEDIFRFLLEAKRVLKPTGKVVFSFLDFDCDSHWPIFLKTVEDRDPHRVLNKFITKNAVQRLARGAALRVVSIYEGTDKWVPISEPFMREDGRLLEGLVEFGQSVAVCSNFPDQEYLLMYPDVLEAIEAGAFLSGAHHYEVCGFREGRHVAGLGSSECDR